MIYFFITLAVAIIAGFLTFIKPRHFLSALSLAGFYTVFLKAVGLKDKTLILTLLIFWIVLWAGFILYGRAEEIKEET